MESVWVVHSVLAYWFWALIPALVCFVPIWMIRQAERSAPDVPRAKRAAQLLLTLLLVCSWLSLVVQLVNPWDGIGAMMDAWQELDPQVAGKVTDEQVSNYLDRKRVLHRQTAGVSHLVLNVLGWVLLSRLKRQKPSPPA